MLHPCAGRGLTYKEVWAAKFATGLLRSDGRAFLINMWDGPFLIDGGQPFLAWRGRFAEVVVQLTFDGTQALCRSFGGEQLASWLVGDKSRQLHRCIRDAIALGGRRIGVVLDDGSLVGPQCTWQHLLIP